MQRGIAASKNRGVLSVASARAGDRVAAHLCAGVRNVSHLRRGERTRPRARTHSLMHARARTHSCTRARTGLEPMRPSDVHAPRCRTDGMRASMVACAGRRGAAGCVEAGAGAAVGMFGLAGGGYGPFCRSHMHANSEPVAPRRYLPAAYSCPLGLGPRHGTHRVRVRSLSQRGSNMEHTVAHDIAAVR